MELYLKATPSEGAELELQLHYQAPPSEELQAFKAELAGEREARQCLEDRLSNCWEKLRACQAAADPLSADGDALCNSWERSNERL